MHAVAGGTVGDKEISGLTLEAMVAIDKRRPPAGRYPIFLCQCYRFMTRGAGGLSQLGFGHRRRRIARRDNTMLTMAVCTNWSFRIPSLSQLSMDAVPVFFCLRFMTFPTCIRNVEVIDGRLGISQRIIIID